MSAAGHTPMVVAAARVLCKRGADECNVDFEDSWKCYGDGYLEDARLALEAAAAPELLEALQELVSADRWLEDSTLCDMTNQAGKRMDRAWDAAKAVISKATGAQA